MQSFLQTFHRRNFLVFLGVLSVAMVWYAGGVLGLVPRAVKFSAPQAQFPAILSGLKCPNAVEQVVNHRPALFVGCGIFE